MAAVSTYTLNSLLIAAGGAILFIVGSLLIKKSSAIPFAILAVLFCFLSFIALLPVSAFPDSAPSIPLEAFAHAANTARSLLFAFGIGSPLLQGALCMFLVDGDLRSVLIKQGITSVFFIVVAALSLFVCVDLLALGTSGVGISVLPAAIAAFVLAIALGTRSGH